MVQPPVTGVAAVDAAAASAIAVYVEKLQPDVPDGYDSARLLSHMYGSSRSLPNTSYWVLSTRGHHSHTLKLNYITSKQAFFSLFKIIIDF